MKRQARRPGLMTLCLLGGAILFSRPAMANVTLPALFSDHTVLQRDMPVPIWGWADPGELVTVSFSGQKKTTIADATGKWSVRLDKLRTDAMPQALTVTGKNTVTVSDVLVGEVWLCAGQSNMTYRLAWGAAFDAAELAAVNDPALRCFTVAANTAPTPDAALQPDGSQVWVSANPDTVAHDFSAVAYYFGMNLRRALGPGVPIGLVHSSYGGTPIEPWISRAGFAKDPALDKMAAAQIAGMAAYPDAAKAFAADVAAWEDKYDAKDAGNTGAAQGWAKPDFDDSAWKTVALPMRFSQTGMAAGGAVWLRKTFDVAPADAGKWLRLQLDYSPDAYAAYFDGTPLHEDGKPKFFEDAHGFYIPASLVHAGPNTLAVRVFAHSSDGGLSIRFGDFGIPMGPDPKTWRYRIEQANPALPADALNSFPTAPDAVPQYTATYIDNAMVAPLIPYAIRGVLWYQGESNVGRAYQYRTLLPALMADWRSRWGEGDLPFYIVQLANFMAVAKQPSESAWAELREAQSLTAQQASHSGLAVTIDIGDPDNIHPKDKADVGKRLALIALARTYGRKIGYSGPLYRSFQAEGGAIRIRFRHTDGGLVAKGGGPLQWFQIAGDDRKFVWADARIDGDSVVVGSPQVAHPVAVRYAWADDPLGCNLYNGAGLPASPFRTDQWPGITVNNH